MGKNIRVYEKFKFRFCFFVNSTQKNYPVSGETMNFEAIKLIPLIWWHKKKSRQKLDINLGVKFYGNKKQHVANHQKRLYKQIVSYNKNIDFELN